MNSKSIRIEHNSQADFVEITSALVSTLSAICKKLAGLLIRTELEKAQESYRAKQQHQMRQQITQDALQGLSIEEKMRHGMYRFMN